MKNALDSLMLAKWQSKIPSSQEMTSALLGVISDIELPDIDTSKNLFVIIKPSSIANNEIEASLQYSTTKEKLSIPIELKSNFDKLNLKPNQQIAIEAKLVENSNDKVELQIINIKLPDAKEVQKNTTNLIIKDTTSSIKNTELMPLKIDTPNLKQSPQIKLELLSFEPQKSEPTKSLEPQINNIKTTAELKTFIEDIKKEPLIGEIIKKPLEQSIAPQKQINKDQAPTNLLAQSKDISYIKTPIGNVFFQKPINLPANTQVTLEISELILEPNANQTTNKPELASKIINTLEPIKQQNKELYNKIINTLPNPQSPKLFNNIINIVQANISKDIKDILPQDVLKEINTSPQQTKDALAKFAEVIISDNKETPIKLNNQFRVIEIPLYNQGNFQKIKLAIKNNNEEQAKQQKNKKTQTRFVLETTFSNLGNFQLDGFATKEDKRFDLIIRTQKQMQKDFITNLTILFNKSLTDVNYTGNITVNNQAFLNVFDKEKPAKQGIFI